jgi:hypothetical protein
MRPISDGWAEGISPEDKEIGSNGSEMVHRPTGYVCARKSLREEERSKAASRLLIPAILRPPILCRQESGQ